MTLVIMGLPVKEIPIKPKGIQFDKDGKKEIYVDSKGARAKKVKISSSEFKWVYEDGSEVEGKTYKSINGKPMRPFSKTAVVDKYDTISVTELPYFLTNELTYLLVNPTFKDKMKELTGQAISFKFVNRGFKVYRAVSYYDPQLDRVIMKCTQGDLRKVDLPEESEVAEIEAEDSVEQMSLDDLEV